MGDLLLMYCACGAETRDDYLRLLADENGLPIAAVQRFADRLGERADFGALVCRCEMARGAWHRILPQPETARDWG